ncbi:MAG: DnaT-like ssDNA-binding protein [Sneathiella sp.]
MTLIVETGAGVVGALSYISLDEADTHYTALSVDSWGSASTGQRENALKQASAHVDFYGYPGSPLSHAQGLKWPRTGVQDKDGRVLSGLPHALTTAVLELASSLLENPQNPLENRQVLKEKIGSLELVYSGNGRKPSFVFKLLMQIGARAQSHEIMRG